MNRRIPIPSMPRTLPQVPYEDLNRELFNFYTPTPYVTALEVDGEPDPGHAPQIPTMQDPPFGDPPYYPSLIHLQCPPWQCPDISAQPFEQTQTACIPWYEVDHPVVNFTVDSTRMMTLTGISYDLKQAKTSDNDIFVVRLLRGGIELARWEDVVISNASTVNRRYAFASHDRPLPLWGVRFDHDEHLTVTVRIRGPRPFTKTSADPFGGAAKVLLNGWQSKQRDTRQGAPKFLTDGVHERASVQHVVADGEHIFQQLRRDG